jgi:acetylornithine deacetylase/succinyl-diaminopimelate desuccinylase-like protein
MFETTVEPNSKWRIRILLVLLALTIVGVLGRFLWMTQMPLRSYAGALPPLTAEESEVRDHLSAEVSYLSVTIGDRSLPRPQSLQAAKDYLSNSLREQGYAVVEHPYSVDGEKVSNLEVIRPGTDSTLGQVIVGAHYDSVAGTVAANDNGTGVAAVLELARLMWQMKFRRTVRFVFFVNEEPPYF